MSQFLQANFECDLCSKRFRAFSSLRWHKSKFHKVKNVCETCGETFTSRGSLYYHRKRKHLPNERAIDTAGAKCGKCNAQLKSTILLCSHLNMVHKMNVKIQHLEFTNRAEFEKWRIETENRGRFKFVSVRGATKLDNIKTEYLYCHRSGPFLSKSEGIRPPKAIPTHKINFSCSAFAKVRTDLVTERVSVKTCVEHYGHDDALPVRLSKNEEIRRRTSRFLNKEKDSDWALRHFCDDEEDSILDFMASSDNSLTYLSSQNVDFNYIQAQRGTLKWVQKSSNDMCSVYLWVKEWESDGSLFCYSPQDGSGNFSLAIQTTSQLEILKKYGPAAISVESTQGTNLYGFILVTVMVVDDFGMGLPIAWLITESEDEAQLARFFLALREKMGSFRTKFFISDNNQSYFNAWSRAFDVNQTQRIVCMRHVLKDWHAQSKAKITNEKNRETIMSQLELLIREQKESDFKLELESFLSILETSEPEFFQYFRNFYCDDESKFSQWAAWAMKNSPITTNLNVERFHKTLKQAYLNNKQNNRLDFLIHVLFCASRDYLRMVLIEMHSTFGQANAAFRQSLLNDRHRAVDDLKPSQLTTIESDKSWRIRVIDSDLEMEFIVRKVSNSCTCKVTCQLCGVCPHMYDCSCPDSIVRVGACKHVHLVHTRPRPIKPAPNNTGGRLTNPIYAIILPPGQQLATAFGGGAQQGVSGSSATRGYRPVLPAPLKIEPESVEEIVTATVSDTIVEPVDPTEPEPVYYDRVLPVRVSDPQFRAPDFDPPKLVIRAGTTGAGAGTRGPVSDQFGAQLLTRADDIWSNLKVNASSSIGDRHVAKRIFKKMQEIEQLCKPGLEEEEPEDHEDEANYEEEAEQQESEDQESTNEMQEEEEPASEEEEEPNSPPPVSIGQMRTRSRSKRLYEAEEPQTTYFGVRPGRRVKTNLRRHQQEWDDQD